jgi:hypothetical protein
MKRPHGFVFNDFYRKDGSRAGDYNVSGSCRWSIKFLVVKYGEECGSAASLLDRRMLKGN